MKSKVLAGLALAGALLFVTTASRIFADDHDKKTDVTITEPVEVPNGVVLQPGTYMFRLMEITGNRHVVQIRSEDGKKTYAIAMVAAAFRTQPTSKVALTFWEMPAGQPPAVRKWFWPGDVDGQEFLYPHKRAAEISKLSKGENVPEASEEDQAAANNVANSADASADIAANNNAAAVNSAKDNNAADSAAVAAAPQPSPAPEISVSQTTVAETTTAATPEPQSDQAQLLAQSTPPAPPSNPAPSVDQSSSQSTTSLPQTASDLPLMALIGSLSLAGALTVRGIRRA